MSAPLLELQGVRAGYEDAVAIDGISLTVGEAEVVCLLGANGAGKTTTMRAVTGLIPLLGGRVLYRGEDVSDKPAHLRVTDGICLSPEGRQVFPELTVLENLMLGSFNQRARLRRTETLEEVFELFPRLKERTGQAAGSMSGGEQQMLAIGRALMGRPSLLALDEPSLGLAPKLVTAVFESIAAIARKGTTILLVEQNTRAALTVAQRGYVLANGRVVHQGTARDLAQSEMVQQAFVGSRARAASGGGVRRQIAGPRPMLEVTGLSKSFGGVRAVSDLSFDLARGEVLGVIGPNGAGKTTLLNLITGYLQPSAGSIRLEGRELRGLAPHEICRLQVARTFQVVRPFAEMTVGENVMTGALFASRTRLSTVEARKRADAALEMVDLLAKRHALAGDLTIGEKKKLELARSLATRPQLLFLDEVMAGLSGSEVEAMMDVVERVAAAGTTILMIEHLVGVILALTDRVLVLDFGRLLFQGAPDEVVAHPEVIDSYLGKPLEGAGMVR